MSDPQVIRYRKKPVTVDTLEWTGWNLAAIREFTGDENVSCPAGGDLTVWNEQEKAWIPVPNGHSVARGALGEFYPVSPAAIAETYEPASTEVNPGPLTRALANVDPELAAGGYTRRGDTIPLKRGVVPPGRYAGGGRSPIVYVRLCPPCAGYAPLTDEDYYGALSGCCQGCGGYSRETHRFPALIMSAANGGCQCTNSHRQVTGDLPTEEAALAVWTEVRTRPEERPRDSAGGQR